jgi:outer membrane protein assembly factor BamA
MLGSGAVLNLYLDPQKSSRVNFLVGFLPGDNKGKKTQITGDLLLDLKNTFGQGESMLVNWQQLQPRSPRLNLGFNQPYIFNTSVGFDFAFDLFRKDSNFLQINTLAGIEYAAGTLHKGKIYLQWQDNKLLEGGMDTAYVKTNRQLPPNIDVRAANLGMQYEHQATNFKPNPRRGNEWMINVSAGIKKIRPNDQIMNLKEATFNYASLYDSIRLSSYLLRIKGWVAKYFPLGRASVLKASFQGGVFQSPDIFRNELFQIGGFRLLRGFDEESIYSTRYAVLTFEYRYLLGERSYLYAFSDAAISRNKYQEVNASNQFLSAGMGINFQTGQGMLSVCYAAGYRNDVPFRLTQASKLHFGYYYYF